MLRLLGHAVLLCTAATLRVVPQLPARPPFAAARAPAPLAIASPLLGAPPPVVAAQLPSVLLADPLDILIGFANSPVVLLIPIVAGALVASLIIWFLIKSASPEA